MNYLHEITGGLDNNKRRLVRELFRVALKEPVVDNELPQCVDLVVGVIEEFDSIGIKEFKVNHVIDTLNIFGVLGCVSGWPPDCSEMIIQVLGHPQIRVARDNTGVYTVPDHSRIKQLISIFCGEEKKKERIKIKVEDRVPS